jgi:hypothetical protein
VSSSVVGSPHLWLCCLHSTWPLSGWLHSLAVAFLGGHPMLLAFLTSWGLHCIYSFTLAASHSGFSVAAFRDSDPVTHCLLPRISFEIWAEASKTPITLSVVMPTKPASPKWCQVCPPALAGQATAASVCLGG